MQKQTPTQTQSDYVCPGLPPLQTTTDMAELKTNNYTQETSKGELSKDKIEELIDRSTHYMDKFDYSKAQPKLMLLVKQTHNLNAQAFAAFKLGVIFAKGCGKITKDMDSAAKYLHMAAEQKQNLTAQAQASLALGSLYIERSKHKLLKQTGTTKSAAIQEDYFKKGILYLKAAAKQNGLQSIKKDAQKMLEDNPEGCSCAIL